MARRRSGYIVSEGGKKMLRGFNIGIGKKRTSVRLSPVIVKAVGKIAERERCEHGDLYSYIDRKKEKGVSRATAIREFVVRYFMDAATETGHRKAGHGRLISKPGRSLRRARGQD
jgi:predicted DNA-binding ribbon-helix-helix protein